MKDFNIIIHEAFRKDMQTKEDAQAFADKHSLPSRVRSELGVEYFEIYLVESEEQLSDYPSYLTPATIRLRLD